MGLAWELPSAPKSPETNIAHIAELQAKLITNYFSF